MNPIHSKSIYTLDTPKPVRLSMYRRLNLIIGICCFAALTDQALAAKHPLPKAGTLFRDCPNCPEMVVIPTGSFMMGSPDTEVGHMSDEAPEHQVNVRAFALGKTEITRGQFAEFVKKTKYNTGKQCWTLEGGKFEQRDNRNWRDLGYLQDNKHPVVCINWNDAKAYAEWLSRKTGKQYRLPTEAEWEYAARGNTHSARYWGEEPDMACLYANVGDLTAQSQLMGASSWLVHNCTDGFSNTAPVGKFKANAFKLRDMLGNVWEWTEDVYHDSYKGAPSDGTAWQVDGVRRVFRGGSWNNGPLRVRAAKRGNEKPVIRFSDIGFRLARKLP